MGRRPSDNFFTCDKCSKRRPVFASDQEKDTKPKECKDLTGTESSCDVPPVYASYYDWSFQEHQGNNFNFKQLNHVEVDLAGLFVFKQAFQEQIEKCRIFYAENKKSMGVNRLPQDPENMIWKAIAVQIGLEKVSGSSLKKFYGKIFNHQMKGSDFEERLLKKHQDYVTRQGPDLRVGLKGELSGAMRVVGTKPRAKTARSETSHGRAQQAEHHGGGKAVRLFEDPPVLPVRTEKVLELLENVSRAARQLGSGGRGGRIHPQTNTVFQKLHEITQAPGGAHSKRRRTLPFFADTGVGKSYIIDNVLRLSERAIRQYCADMEDDELESIAFIEDSLTQPEQNMLPGAGSGDGEEGDLDIEQSRKKRFEELRKWLTDGKYFFQLSEDAPRKFLSKNFKLKNKAQMKPHEIEESHTKSIKAYTESQPHDVQHVEAFTVPFLLPWGNENNSTTLVSIAIRHSKRYQVVVEYHSEAYMRTEVWGPQAKGERPDKSGFSSVLKSVRRAMGWSGKSADKTAEAEAKKFLDDSLPSKEPPRLDSMPELKSVLGQVVAISGEGQNRLVDRCLMRRILHVAQGFEDKSLGNEVADQDKSLGNEVADQGGGLRVDTEEWSEVCDDPIKARSKIGHLLGSFDHNAQIDFGKKTCYALKRITLWVPCGIAPGLDGEWVDTAGCNDSGLRQRAVLQEELNRAEQLAVVVRKNLGLSTNTTDYLRESKLSKRIAGLTSGPVSAKHSMMVIHNWELDRKEKPIDQEGLDDEEGNIEERNEYSKEQLRDDFLANELRGPTDESDAWKEEILNRIPLLHPAVSLFTALAFSDKHVAGFEKLLESTGGFELLGHLEHFLKAGSRMWVEEVLNNLKNEENGLCKALRDVRESIKTKKIPGKQKKDLRKTWLREPVGKSGIEGMRSKFSEVLGTIGKRFSETFSQKKDSVMKTLEDELNRARNAVAQRKETRSKMLYVGSIYVQLSGELNELIGKHVDDLVTQLRDDFQPKVKEAFEDFVNQRLQELKLPAGEFDEHIRRIKQSASEAVGLRFSLNGHPSSFGNVVKDHVKRSQDTHFGALEKKLHRTVNGMEPEERLKYLEEFENENLLDFWQAAFDVVEDVKRGLTRRVDREGDITSNFLQQLDLVTRTKTRERGTSIRVMFNIVKGAEEILFETEPWSNQDEERLHDLKALEMTLEKVCAEWRKDTAPKDTGKQLFRDFRRSRILDQNIYSGQFQSERSDETVLLDKTPSKELQGLHHPDKGFLPLVGPPDSSVKEKNDRLIELCNKAQGHRLEHGTVSALKEMLENNGKLFFVAPDKDEEPGPDDFLSSYLVVAQGYEPQAARDPETLLKLRSIISTEAARWGEEYEQVLKVMYSGLDGFRDFIMGSKNTEEVAANERKCPDLLALCFISEIFERRINLYVPWETTSEEFKTSALFPLRIEPEQLSTKMNTGRTHADAVVLFGRAAKGGLHLQMCTTKDDLDRLHELRNARTYSIDGEEEGDDEGATGSEDDDDDDEQDHHPDDAASGEGTDGEAAEKHDVQMRDDTRGDAELDERSDDDLDRSPWHSGFATPELKSNVETPPSGMDARKWKFATFASSCWVQKDGRMELASENNEGPQTRSEERWVQSREWFDSVRREKAQFAERFNVIRGMPYLSGKTENKLEKYMNPKTMPCDDASSESDNFLSVFDGVGACGVWSGKFARQLAIEARRHSKNEVCLFDKDKELTKDKDNRSITILKSAHRKSIENLEKRMKEPGASTAVVLSLTSCPGTSGQKHVLHECVYGDSRWALLRKKGEGYECAYLSHEMYYAQRSDRPMTPMQLQSPSQKLHEGSKFYWKFRYVYEDDVVIVGSDGLFDNLVIEGSRRKPSDEVLKLELERAMQETCERCKDGCEVCKVMRDEGRIPVLCIGEHLQRVASENMKRTGGKPDDLAITVSRISMGTRPDLTKQTCTEMKVSAICSDVFSRA